MADIFLTNSLSGKKEKFIPLNPPHVGMYTCGPTVYYHAHIGNFRTYTMADILFRVLQNNGFQVNHVMNLTDVGHLTGDNLGDADIGEDRIERAARREGKTAWDIAKFYTRAFLKDMQKLNIKKPQVMPKATEHIQEQIDLVKRLEEKGFTYKISDGIYFDIPAFEKKTGKKYGELSTLDKIKAGARVKQNPEKKDPRDFALWKFSEKPGLRHMEWKSPWGLGFPGWHIECSAMSIKYLGESFDIHIGGEDLRSIHHPNEIVQAEGATGKQFVRFWLHVTFLQVEGGRMGKSLGNFYTISDIEEKGFEPLALRYLYLTTQYRDSLNFTWEGMKSAQTALSRLKNSALEFRQRGSEARTILSPEKMDKLEDYRQRFQQAINDDLNTPQALAVLWGLVKSNIPREDKYDLMLSFDEVLGLGLSALPVQQTGLQLPREVKSLLGEREKLRKEGKFKEADRIREEIEKKGWRVKDTSKGTIVEPAHRQGRPAQDD